jgi:DNA-binding CsgD family transcriptional regulator
VEEPGHTHPPSSDAPRVRQSCGLAAWRLDVGEDEYALFEWPEPWIAERVRGRLTPAEREVARFIAAGVSNAEIAWRRGSSQRTVANQAARIFRKLGVTSRLGFYSLLARAGPEHAEEPP